MAEKMDIPEFLRRGDDVVMDELEADEEIPFDLEEAAEEEKDGDDEDL